VTPEQAAAHVLRWVRLYTRSLPAPVAERRLAEIEADLHDHVAHERAHGTAERRIALSVVARMARGMAADASWRRRTIARTTTRKEPPKMSQSLSRPVVRVAVATVVILLLPLATTLLSDGPGWSVADFVIAAALLGGTGLLLELAARNPRNVVARAAAVAIGVAAVVLGEMDDAPGLVLFGCVLILGTIALTVRTAQRSE
jgi:hypothetical protein